MIFDWKQRKLGEVAKTFSGGTPSIKNDANYNGNIPFIRSGEIENTTTELSISQHALNTSAAKLVTKGTILYALYGATSGEVAISRTSGAINQAILAIIPKSDNIYFIYSCLTKDKKQIVSKYLQGGQGNLSGKIINNLNIYLPSKLEQVKIGKLHQLFDETISIQERKLKLLNKTNKSLIQRIFKTKYENPTLYLRNIAQIWNLIQIKEIGNIVTGNTPSTHNIHYYSNSGKPWVTPVDLTTENTLIKQSSKRLTNEGWRASRHVPKNSILITSIGSIGKNGLTQSETAFNQQINALVPGKGHDPYFLLKNSQIWSQEMSRIAGQSTLPIVNKTEFSKLTTYLPLIESEKIIGKLFFKFDNYIQKEQKKLSQLKQIKKFLLQNMFI